MNAGRQGVPPGGRGSGARVRARLRREVWGYNGSTPGPTIEVVEGDRVRIFVTNRLPEHTTIHWHGQRTCPMAWTAWAA
jgi:FtsP/CotA-like multicopper oxidase with cupredoxin domain